MEEVWCLHQIKQEQIRKQGGSRGQHKAPTHYLKTRFSFAKKESTTTIGLWLCTVLRKEEIIEEEKSSVSDGCEQTKLLCRNHCLGSCCQGHPAGSNKTQKHTSMVILDSILKQQTAAIALLIEH